MDAVQIDFEAIPSRAERFLETYRPAVARVLAYGAEGYLFFRSDEDPDHFVHVSFWENRADFERYWYSREMREVRERLSGLHAQPVLPHWGTVVEQG